MKESIHELNSQREAECRGTRLDAQLLSDLWIFRAAAQQCSITAAARQLNVTQGAVSQRILRLESRLGVELFKRHKGRINLTEAGATVLEAVSAASARLDGALASIDRDRRSLVVSCSPSLATEWLMPRLQDFYDQCPGIDLLVRAEISPPSAEWMIEERLDVMIDYLHAGGDDLVELASVQEYTFPVCSTAYRDLLLARPDAAGVVLLHDDAAWQEGEGAGAEWAEWLAAADPPHGLKVTGEQRFNLAYMAYQAAMYGQGLALGRAVSVNRLLRQGDLVAAPGARLQPSAHYRVFAVSPVQPEAPVARFAAWLEEALLRTRGETMALLGASASG